MTRTHHTVVPAVVSVGYVLRSPRDWYIPAPPSRVMEPNWHTNPYRITSRLARGGMSDLFLGLRDREGAPPERIVLKRLRPELREDGRFLRFFRTEVEIALQLEHANLVRVIDTPVIADDVYIAMEFVEGKNLQRTFKRSEEQRERPPLGVGMYIGEQVLRGLAYIHRPTEPRRFQRVIHRDVKPANILVSFAGEVKIADFGIARADMLTEVGTQENNLIGTISYLAPEQIQGRLVTERTDLYSFGVVLIELLSNQRLFDSRAPATVLLSIRNGDHRPVDELLPEAPRDLCRLLEALVDPSPDGRPSSAREVERALASIRRRTNPSLGAPEVARWLAGLFDPTPHPPTRRHDAIVLPDSLRTSVIGAHPLTNENSLLGPPEPPKKIPPVTRRIRPPSSSIVVRAASAEEKPTERADTPVVPPSPPDRTRRSLLIAGGYGAGLLTAGGFFAGYSMAQRAKEPPIAIDIEPPPVPLVSQSLAPEDGFLTVRGPRGARVFVDDVRLPGRAPMNRVRIRAGDHVVRIVHRRRRRRRRTRHVVIESGQETKL